MITGRATAVTKSSIKSLYKVCCRGSYSSSVKVGPLCKNLSTATEAYPYYQNRVGNDSETGSLVQDGVVGGGGRDRSLDLNKGLGNDGLNRNFEAYGGNLDKRNARVSVGGSAQSFDRNIRENRQVSNGVGEYRQEWDGYKWSNPNMPSQNLREQAGDVSYRGGDGGHLTNGNVGQFSRNVGGLGSGNGGVYNRDGANVTNYQTSETSGAVSSFGQYQAASDNNYAASNNGQYQAASNNSYAASNNGQYQAASNNNYPASNFGQYQQANNSNYASSNFGQHQPAVNSNHAASNYGQYQRVDNNNYAPSVGAYQHTTRQQNEYAGPPEAKYYNYQSSNVSQQNPYGNLIYNRNAATGPTAQYPSTTSQVPGHSNMGGTPNDAPETPQIRGTIEELVQYTKEGKLKEALEVLEHMEKNQQRLVPERDMSTVVMLMEACGEAKADKEAKIVHEALVKLMSPLTVTTFNMILDMYLKCGSIEEAYSLFNDIPNADVTSWNTMIRGLVKNDLGEEALDIYTEFKNTELKPDGQMFLGVFSACGIVGDVAEGMLHFRSMSKQYGITPLMEHYVGVVEMLGHSGYLDNALEFVENMPVKPSVDVWETLMHVSRIQGNVELGDRCAELVEKLDPSRLSDQSKAGLIPLKASDLEKEKEKKKLASKNLLEVRSRVHEYRAGDTSHPENDRIYALLRGLKTQMKEAGYIPELRGVLHDIDPEGKEEALLAHSERLAAAYGFLTTAARQPIRVIKNLRVCVDCHNALKIISKLVGRELIMRDAKRFHHFKDGVCSCKDYW